MIWLIISNCLVLLLNDYFPKSLSGHYLGLLCGNSISDENSWKYSTVIGYRQKQGKIDVEID